MIALVLGCAASVFDDAAAALSICKPDITVGVNHIARDWPYDIDHWASCHAEDFPAWTAQRAAQGGNIPPCWTSDIRANNTPDEPYMRGLNIAPYWDGTSAALAVSVAKLQGADRIILAGVPLKNGPHYYQGPDFTPAADMQVEWLLHLADLEHVRSMSGWTARTLGVPTSEWLAGTGGPFLGQI